MSNRKDLERNYHALSKIKNPISPLALRKKKKKKKKKEKKNQEKPPEFYEVLNARDVIM